MTSLRSASGRYSISVSGPTESRLENELKGRCCPERLRTRTGEVQCVAAPESIKKHHLKLEDVVEIVGRVRREDRAKAGYELDILQVCFPQDTHAAHPAAEGNFLQHKSRKGFDKYALIDRGHPAKTSSKGEFCWSQECGGAIQLPVVHRRSIRAVS